MSALDNYRAQHPEYGGVGDVELSNALYKKYYADKMPREEFDKRIGLPASQLAAPPNPMIASPKAGPAVIPADTNNFGATEAALSGDLHGLPIVGPSVEKGADWIGALMHSLFTGDTMEQSQGLGKIMQENTNLAYPGARKAGEVAGGIQGYATLGALAPEAMGAGGASLPVRAAIAGATNAAIAGADTAARGGSLADVGKSGAAGLALGAAAPVVGGIVGAAVRPVARAVGSWFSPAVPGMRSSAANNLAEALATDSAIKDVPTRLRELGPESSLADAGPTLLGKAQGVSAAPGEARSMVIGDQVAREAGATGRIGSDVSGAIGPYEEPIAATEALKAKKGVISQALPGIYGKAPPVDITGVLSSIGQRLSKLPPNGIQATALRKIRDLLMVRNALGKPQAIARAEALDSAKGDIDTFIDHGDPTLGVTPGAISKTQGAVADIRKQLNQALRDQVPGYGDTMDKLALLNRQMEQIESGAEDVIGKGLPPSRLAAEWARLSPEEQAAKALGVKAAIYRKLGTIGNDRVALKSAIGGEGDFNRANLEIIFGKAATDKLLNTLDREATFASTYSDLARNSMTAPRLAAAKSMGVDEAGGAHLGTGLAALHPGALPAYLGLRGLGSAWRSIKNTALEGRNLDIAKAMVTGDPIGLADALVSRGASREAAAKAGAKGGSDLARALVGYEGGVRKGKDLPPPSTLMLPAAMLMQHAGL